MNTNFVVIFGLLGCSCLILAKPTSSNQNSADNKLSKRDYATSSFDPSWYYNGYYHSAYPTQLHAAYGAYPTPSHATYGAYPYNSYFHPYQAYSLGYSAPAPTAYSAPTPTVYSAPAPTGYSAPAPTVYSAPAPTGYSAPAPTPFIAYKTLPSHLLHKSMVLPEPVPLPKAAPKPETISTPDMTKSEIRDEAGQYALSFATSNGIRASEQGFLAIKGNSVMPVKKGTYEYTSPEGTPVSMSYTADDNGFNVEGFPLPKAPEPTN